MGCEVRSPRQAMTVPDCTSSPVSSIVSTEQGPTLSPDFISGPEADHFLHSAQPELVLKTIQQTVEARRDLGT